MLDEANISSDLTMPVSVEKDIFLAGKEMNSWLRYDKNTHSTQVAVHDSLRVNILNALSYLPDLIHISDSILNVLKSVGILPACVFLTRAAYVSFAIGSKFLLCTATQKKAAYYL